MIFEITRKSGEMALSFNFDIYQNPTTPQSRHDEYMAKCISKGYTVERLYGCKNHVIYQLTIPKSLCERILLHYEVLGYLGNGIPAWIVQRIEDNKLAVIKIRSSRSAFEYEVIALNKLSKERLAPCIIEAFSFDDDHHVLIEEWIEGDMLDDTDTDLMVTWAEQAKKYWEADLESFDFAGNNFILTPNQQVVCIDLEPPSSHSFFFYHIF